MAKKTLLSFKQIWKYLKQVYNASIQFRKNVVKTSQFILYFSAFYSDNLDFTSNIRNFISGLNLNLQNRDEIISGK